MSQMATAPLLLFVYVSVAVVIKPGRLHQNNGTPQLELYLLQGSREVSFVSLVR